MTNDLQHLDAVIKLAEIELLRDDWQSRSGVFRALLDQAMPFLRQLTRHLIKKQATLAVLETQLAIARANASERSDPASNADVDQEIQDLLARIKEVAA